MQKEPDNGGHEAVGTEGAPGRHRIPIVVKLILSYSLLILLPISSVAWILSTAAEQNIHTNTVTYVNMFVEQVSSGIDSFVSELDRLTKIIALDDELPGILTAEELQPGKAYLASRYLDEYMLKMMTQQPGICCVTVIGRTGRIYTCGSNQIQDTAAFSQTLGLDWMNEKKHDLRFSGAHKPTYLLIGTADPVFCVMRDLYLYNEYVGSVVLHINLDRFMETVHMAQTVSEIDARIIVTNPENQVVADTMANSTDDWSLGSEPFCYDPTRPDNGEFLRYTNESRYSGLTTTILIDRSQVFSNIHSFRVYAITLTVLLAGIVFVLSVAFSFHLVRPIKALRRATDEYARGNYDVRVFVRSRDEIGDLCRGFNSMAERLNLMIDRVYRYRLETETAQLKALQSQINPHFLHNTLETIRMKALINGDKDVANMIKMLARLFRITLERKKNIVMLREELEHAQTYVDLQNMRFNDRFHLDIRIAPGLEDIYVMKLTLQPLVENCIVHGFQERFDQESICISVEEANGDILISVTDNGAGIEVERLRSLQTYLTDTQVNLDGRDEHRGIGVVNIMSRIRLEYGSAYGLEIRPNEPRGTCVVMKLPKNRCLYSTEQS